MKKRFLSILLALCMALPLLPLQTLAANDAMIQVRTQAELNEAIGNIAEGGTIQLTADISVSGTSSDRITIPSTNSKSFTIDLNGHTLKSTGAGSEYDYAITIDHQGKGILTIDDTSVGGGGQVTTYDASAHVIAIRNGGKLTIKNGTICSSAISINNLQSCTVNVEGGTVTTFTIMSGQEAAGAYGRLGIAIQNSTQGGRVNISGGLIESKYVQAGTGILYGTVYLSGGTIQAPDGDVTNYPSIGIRDAQVYVQDIPKNGFAIVKGAHAIVVNRSTYPIMTDATLSGSKTDINGVQNMETNIIPVPDPDPYAEHFREYKYLKFEYVDPYYKISATPATLNFGEATVGYPTAPAAQTVTVKNTGNRSVTLTQPTATDYTIGTLSATTLAANETATFTVTPKTGLTEGAHNETISISGNDSSGSNSVSATVSASFQVTTSTHVHPICGETCTHSGSHEAVSWIEWDGAAADTDNPLTTGNYFLTADNNTSVNAGSSGVIDRKIYIAGTVNLCLNGHQLTNCQFIVKSGGSLTICDHSAGKGVISHKYFDLSGTIGGESGTTINLYGGTVKNTTNGDKKNSITTAGGTVNLYGGIVNDVSANDAASVITLGGTPKLDRIIVKKPSTIKAKTPDGTAYNGDAVPIEFGGKVENGTTIVTDVVEANQNKFQLTGSYSSGQELVLKDTNLVLQAKHYAVTVASGITNGSITVNPASAAKNEAVTITAAPSAGYELESVSVTKTGATTALTTSGSGNTRTFNMPEYGVTVSATFKKTADQTSVENAKSIIEGGAYTVAQADANTEGEVKAALVTQISALTGMADTGITVGENNITISAFNAATAGDAQDENGANGSFSFTIALTKGTASATTDSKSGTITATKYVAPVLTSISVETAPKITYLVGETFDPTDLALTLTYDKGDAGKVTYSQNNKNDFTFSPDTSTVLTTSNTSVTITYGGKTTQQSITVTLRPESRPNATFTATSENTGTLSNVESGMKYRIDEGDWKDISSDRVLLTKLSACTIFVVKKGDGITTTDSTAQSIQVTKGAAVSGVTATNCTTTDNNDGQLKGVTTAMEYRPAGQIVWTAGTGSDITGLASGQYQIRTKMRGAALAGEITTVTIAAFEAEPLTGTVTISGKTEWGNTLIATYSSDNNTGTLYYQWKRDNTEINGENAYFYQTVEADIGHTLTCVVTSNKQSGSVSGSTSGAIKKKSVHHTIKSTTITYTGSTYDVTALFTLDKNAGAATYVIEGWHSNYGKGELNGTTLTITEAGEIYIAVETSETAAYAASSKVVATLTVNSGVGSGTVTMDNWTAGETASEPVPASTTNGTTNVTYSYSGREGTSYGPSSVKPTDVGKYTVTATFAATGLYASFYAQADFSINAKANAVAPTITKDLETTGATYTVNDSAAELSITAEVSDGGSLSYQWYSSNTGSSADGKKIDGETGTTYTPSTATVGTTYYYCVITNTNDKATGAKTATATTNIVKINVVAVLTGTVEIRGALKFNVPLTAVYSGGNNTGNLSYQWKRADVNIDGATNEVYTTVEEDIGQILTCVVTSSMEAGSISRSTSAIIAKADGPNAPSVTFSFDGPNAGKLVDATATMEYSLNGGKSYSTCTDDTDLSSSQITAEYDILIRVKETGTAEAGAAQTIDITRAAPPSASKADCTTSANNDGKLTGVTSAMRWKQQDGDWKDGTDSDITGLSAGTYYIQVKATGTVLASQTQTLSIAAYSNGGYTPPALVTAINSGDSITRSHLNELISQNKTLTVTGDYGARMVFDTDALNGIRKEASGSVVFQIDDVTEQYQDVYSGQNLFSLTVASGGKTITEFGGSVAVSLPFAPGEGEQPENVAVWHLADDGAKVKIFSAYDADTGLVSFTASHFFSLYLVSTEAWKNPFADVNDTDWFYDDVAYVSSTGMMNGTGIAEFSPHETTTRGMIVTILYRLEGEPAVSGKCPFTDVASGRYYENAVLWAAENNIAGGYGGGRFGPDDKITREQMAVILYRYANFKGCDMTALADLSKFNDMESISNFAVTAMQWANANNLIGGKGNDILDPVGKAERCEVAAILHRFCENLIQQ